MAHFAQLDDKNIVQQIIVIDNKYALTEKAGEAYIKDVLKLDGTWMQTSYNANIRGRYAGVNDIYDPEIDEFIVNVKYQEEQEQLRLEQNEKLEIEKLKKEAIATKIGLTLEELQTILNP